MKEEKLNGRDVRINNKLRDHGKCPWADIDCLEGDRSANPVASYELKHGNISIVNLNEYSIKLHRNTAYKLQIPYFIVIYYPQFETNYESLVDCKDWWDNWQYYIFPENVLASKFMKKYYNFRVQQDKQGLQMSDYEFVKFRYLLRNNFENFNGKDKFNNDLDQTIIPINVPDIGNFTNKKDEEY